MTIAFLLTAIFFRLAFVLMDVIAFFVVVRILCDGCPASLLQDFNHAGKPLVDRVVATVDRTRRRLGLGPVHHVHACALALAALGLLQLTVGWVVLL